MMFGDRFEKFVYLPQQREVLREARTMLAICTAAMAFLCVYPETSRMMSFVPLAIAVWLVAAYAVCRPAKLLVLPSPDDLLWLCSIGVAGFMRFAPTTLGGLVMGLMGAGGAHYIYACLDNLFDLFMTAICRRLQECPYASAHHEIPQPLWSHLIRVHRIAHWANMFDWPHKIDYDADGVPHITYTDHHNETETV